MQSWVRISCVRMSVTHICYLSAHFLVIFHIFLFLRIRQECQELAGRAGGWSGSLGAGPGSRGKAGGFLARPGDSWERLRQAGGGYLSTEGSCSHLSQPTQPWVDELFWDMQSLQSNHNLWLNLLNLYLLYACNLLIVTTNYGLNLHLINATLLEELFWGMQSIYHT